MRVKFNIYNFYIELFLDDNESALNRPIAFVTDWPKEIQSFIQHLKELGLIYFRKKKDGYIFTKIKKCLL